MSAQGDKAIGGENQQAQAEGQLESFSDYELTQALRRRGLAVSVWGAADVIGLVRRDDEADGLDEEQLQRVAEAVMKRIQSGLEDRLGSCGNDYMEDRWEALKEEFLSEVAANENQPSRQM